MWDNVLLTQPRKNKKPAHELINLKTLVQAQLRDSFCRQIQERLNKGHHLPFRLSVEGLLQRTVHPKPVVFNPKSLQQRDVHMKHHRHIARHLGGQKVLNTRANTSIGHL